MLFLKVEEDCYVAISSGALFQWLKRASFKSSCSAVFWHMGEDKSFVSQWSTFCMWGLFRKRRNG